MKVKVTLQNMDLVVHSLLIPTQTPYRKVDYFGKLNRWQHRKTYVSVNKFAHNFQYCFTGMITRISKATQNNMG